MNSLVLFAFITVQFLFIFLPLQPILAQTAKVPITYPGDTDQTIARRVQWIEGAKKEGAVVWWGTLEPRLGARYIAEFNKIYPFLKVQFWSARSREITVKVEPQAKLGHAEVDVCLGGVDPYDFPRWRKMGLMAKFTDIIPGINKMHKGMYSMFGDWAIPGNNALIMQYNTKLVPAAEAPKSWEELLEPKWKGQIGIAESSLKHWAGLALADGGWGIEKTENYLRKLKQQEPRFGRGFTATHMLLVAGEFKVSAGGYIYHVFNSQKKAAPVDWVRANPVLITGSGFNMMNNPPHPNAAKLFLEWAMSQPGLSAWEKITLKGAAFPGSGTMTSKALAGLRLLYKTEEVELKMADSGIVEGLAKILGVSPDAGE